MSNFDDLAMAVASFGGNNAVKFDDLGMPSIMVGIPKMKYSDIITGGTQETLPWWIVDGVEKEVIWVSKYINVVVNDRAYSLPMKTQTAPALLHTLYGRHYNFTPRQKVSGKDKE